MCRDALKNFGGPDHRDFPSESKLHEMKKKLTQELPIPRPIRVQLEVELSQTQAATAASEATASNAASTKRTVEVTWGIVPYVFGWLRSA